MISRKENKVKIRYTTRNACYGTSTWYFWEWNFLNSKNVRQVGFRIFGIEVIFKGE